MGQLNDRGSIDSSTYLDDMMYMKDCLAETLFIAAFWFDTKQPIDKVYGLYSFFESCFVSSLPGVDYTKTAADVYGTLIWAWVDSRSDLSILKLAARPGHVDELQIPSWVPAWHQKHPSYFNATVSETNLLKFDLQHLFLDTPFSWLYTKRANMRATARSEVTHFGPIAKQMSPGKLQILRTRYVGRLCFASGVGCPEQSFVPIFFTSHQIGWCWAVHAISSFDEREAAISEMFRSIYMPGIQPIGFFPSGTDTMEEHFEAFRTWFDFMVHLQHQSQQCPTSDNSGASYGTTRLSQAAALYIDIWLADSEEAAIAVLEARYSGNTDERESLANLARQIRIVGSVLVLVRNHAFCVLDNKMLAVGNYWCCVDDEVFVFPGADTPFVVRRENEGDCYRLVGPVLVDRLCAIGYQKWRAEGEDLKDIALV